MSFNFHETAVLKSGYVRNDPKHSGVFIRVLIGFVLYVSASQSVAVYIAA